MNTNRFQGIAFATPRSGRTAPAFVACPAALRTWAGTACPWEQVYRTAYERAVAVARPSILERLQANLLN